MEQIQLEYEAAQRLTRDFAAGAGKHKFITARMETMGRCHQRLVALMGEREETLAYAQAMEGADLDQNMPAEKQVKKQKKAKR
jgi:hypothetical protein